MKMSAKAGKKAAGKDMKKMSPKDRFAAMMEAKKKKGAKGKSQKASITAKKPKKATGKKTKLSITAKKPKTVKHKKKGRV